MLREIILPETQPETEWIDGHAVQKVSPTYDHGLLQLRIGAWLRTWAEETAVGRVATEWRFRVSPPGEVVRPLVPDVSFVSFEALPKATPRSELATPLVAPTVAFEILSPDDRKRDVASKIETLLAAGTYAIVVVDPKHETVTIHDADGPVVYSRPELVTHPALPAFVLDLDRLFADMD